jgi:acetyl-CoA C-acetyltransferase
MTAAGALDGRAPCLIGVGQVMTRSTDPGETEPIELWAQAAASALADAGSRRTVTTVNRLAVVRCDSWSYDAPAQRLADRLGLSARQLVDSPLGGHQPQALLHAMADAIARGEMDLALVVSGEALHTAGALARQDVVPPWEHAAPAPPEVDPRQFFHDSETSHGLLPIMRSFALRDSARRAHLGAAQEAYEREPAPVYATMSAQAAANPHAWHQQARSAEEILRVGPENRMPVHPYRKFMMASPKVNQAAALMVASQAEADALGVAADRRVYLRGWASARDHPYVAQNEDLWRSPAMARAASDALAAAGLGVDDLSHFDLYSCFPSAVRFATDALGRRFDDGRGVTVTGGMPYAGAPGSGYVTHALAAMALALRAHPGGAGLVSGLSAQMASHAFTVLSAEPASGSPAGFGAATPTAPVVGPVALRARGNGPAVVDGYAVACTPAGDDEMAVAVCTLPEGDRCYAQTRQADLLQSLSGGEGVGRRVELAAGPGGLTQMVG